MNVCVVGMLVAMFANGECDPWERLWSFPGSEFLMVFMYL